VIVTPLTFQPILFTGAPELDGWTYNALTGEFTCPATGKYLISYDVSIGSTVAASRAAVRGEINGLGVIASAQTQTFFSTTANQIWSNEFIITINGGDIFTLQFAGTSVAVTIKPGTSVAAEIPGSASMTIVRIV
jgi:hypothetical protein